MHLPDCCHGAGVLLHLHTLWTVWIEAHQHQATEQHCSSGKRVCGQHAMILRTDVSIFADLKTIGEQNHNITLAKKCILIILRFFSFDAVLASSHPRVFAIWTLGATTLDQLDNHQMQLSTLQLKEFQLVATILACTNGWILGPMGHSLANSHYLGKTQHTWET